MKLSDNVYNVLKWLALIVIPAVGVFYSAMAGAWGLPYAEQIAQTCNAIAVLIGTIIGVSTYTYNANNALVDESYEDEEDGNAKG